MSRLLDPAFKYTPAAAQSVMETWRKAGWKPTTQAERNARIRRQMTAAPQEQRKDASALPGRPAIPDAHAPAVAAPNVRELKRWAK